MVSVSYEGSKTGHIGTSGEFGALVQYIVSEEAGFVTGHVFNLTRGLRIGYGGKSMGIGEHKTVCGAACGSGFLWKKK